MSQNPALSPPAGYLYQPYYCEENIWQLCQHASLEGYEKNAVFLSNSTRSLAIWGQRAAPHGEMMVWDYHVILLGRATPTHPWMVFDLDTLWGFPVQASAYLANSFAGVESWPQQYRPMFRVIPSDVYVQRFCSDRSHMRSSSGAFLQPPPPWPAIVSHVTEPSGLEERGMGYRGVGAGNNLQQCIDMSGVFVGEVLSLLEMQERYAAS